MERNIRLIVAYDGTDLKGYQRQENGLTVQECLETALSRLCNEPITVYGASRTDAGVHAKYQIITFFTTGTIPIANIPRAMIAHLPNSIVVCEAQEVPIDWRARHHTYGKEYVYSIRNHSVENPLRSRYHWHIKKTLDVAAMEEAGRLLEGTHDFTAFKGVNTTPANPVKTVYAIRLVLRGEMLYIHVIGDGFLYHMVRNIAGYLVEVGLGRKSAKNTSAILAQKDRSLIGRTAPAKGLCLEKIFFTESSLQDVIKYLDACVGGSQS